MPFNCAFYALSAAVTSITEIELAVPLFLFHNLLRVCMLIAGNLGIKVCSYSPDVDIIQTTVSIEEFIERKMLEAAFEGPLTEDEQSGNEEQSDTDDGSHDSSSSNGSSRSVSPAVRRKPPVTRPIDSHWELFDGPVTDCDCDYCAKLAMLQRPLTRKEKERIRKKIAKRAKREALREQKQSSQKAIVEKRVAEALNDVIMSTGYSLETDAPVTATGYVGKSTTLRHDQLVSLSELCKYPGMTHYPWDGK